jgi:hypothetical protein
MTTQTEHINKTKLVLGLIVFFVLFSFAPTFYEWAVRGRIHDDRQFELVHNFPTDYNLYLSRIRQGKEGAWLATEKYTSETHVGSLSQILYVWIGRLANASHVQTPYVWFAYHVARAFFAGLLLWVIWKVVEWGMKAASGQWQVLTYLLIVTASTWPKFEWVAGFPRFGGYMPWYTMADSLQRTTFMPHVTLAQALLAFIVLVFSGGFISKALPGNWIFLGVVGLILGVVFPPGLLFIYGILVGVSLVEWVGTKIAQKSVGAWVQNDLFGRVIFGIITMPTVVYYGLLLQQYPWKRLVEFDVLHPTKFSYMEYFLAVGPVLPLGLLGLVGLLVWRPKETWEKLKYFIVWIISWLGFLFLFNQIPQQSPTRFTQMVPHIPLGLVGAYALYQLGNTSVVKRKYSFVLYSLLFLPVALGLGSMASSYMWLKDFVDHKLRATLPIVPTGAQVMYPMKETILAMTWLQVYTPRQAVVLSGMTTGNSIPVYAGNTAYVGHANTVNLEDKLLQVEFFYTRYNGKLTPVEGLKWLRDEHISYVLYGFEEREINGGMVDLRELYPALEQVYESPNVRIYKVPSPTS